MNHDIVTNNLTLNYHTNSNIYIHFHFLSVKNPRLSFIPVNEAVDSHYRYFFLQIFVISYSTFYHPAVKFFGLM
jgi:hypothetical protein